MNSNTYHQPVNQFCIGSFRSEKKMKLFYFFILLSMMNLCDASSKKTQVRKTLSSSKKIPVKSIKVIPSSLTLIFMVPVFMFLCTSTYLCLSKFFFFFFPICCCCTRFSMSYCTLLHNKLKKLST